MSREKLNVADVVFAFDNEYLIRLLMQRGHLVELQDVEKLTKVNRKIEKYVKEYSE
jgi:hypothetical protein